MCRDIFHLAVTESHIHGAQRDAGCPESEDHVTLHIGDVQQLEEGQELAAIPHAVVGNDGVQLVCTSSLISGAESNGDGDHPASNLNIGQSMGQTRLERIIGLI